MRLPTLVVWLSFGLRGPGAAGEPATIEVMAGDGLPDLDGERRGAWWIALISVQLGPAGVLDGVERGRWLLCSRVMVAWARAPLTGKRAPHARVRRIG
jgi:hypothetical protein